MGFETAVQEAIVLALTDNIGCQVYDSPPKTAAYPYAIVGDDAFIEFDTNTTVGRECITTVHVFDNYNGKKRIKQIIGEIDNLLNRATLTAIGFHFIDCVFDSSDIFLDSDGKTYHGVILFRLLIDRG
jgi:hypothetical protein